MASETISKPARVTRARKPKAEAAAPVVLDRSTAKIGQKVRVTRADGKEMTGTLKCWGAKIIVVGQNGLDSAGRDWLVGETTVYAA